MEILVVFFFFRGSLSEAASEQFLLNNFCAQKERLKNLR